jgi:hypothetical protein
MMTVTDDDQHAGHSDHTPDGACIYSPEDIGRHILSERDGLNNPEVKDKPVIAYAVIAIHERDESKSENSIPDVSVIGHKPSPSAVGMILAFGQLTLSTAQAEAEEFDDAANAAARAMAEALRRRLFGDVDPNSESDVLGSL